VGRKKRGRGKGRKGPSDPTPPRPPDIGLLGAIPAATLDLHGERAAEAERKVTDFVTAQSRIHRGDVIHVVTGSGQGSQAGPVLRGLVGELLAGSLERFVAEHRMDLHRGGWLARLR